MHFLNDTRGYTLLEAIFQLLMLVIFAHLLVWILLWFTQFQQLEVMQDEVNWELFVVDVRTYLEQAQQVAVINNGQAIQFRVFEEGESRLLIVEKSTTNHIRKRVPMGGHEIMLPYANEIKFDLQFQELSMQVQMNNGQKRERIFIVPMD